ncbi:MAG: Xaa-Pro peptidase family protein [Spirochaetales bacterium]|nr:Xaa-Pro peptidase family protein [Spirochaetales bacterium]MCF7938420.1 Xaa-Pro peptidase family protein [Spirochaetales bacterium]
MRLDPFQSTTYDKRIERVQKELKKRELDVLVGYSSESESATSRYLSGFWPFFDFAGVVVPSEGEPALITGGPESYEFAKVFSGLKNILVNPLFVETSAPEWVPDVKEESFKTIIPRVCGKTPKRIGVANWNIFPFPIIEDLKDAAPHAELLPADDVLLHVQAVKDEEEIPYIREAYRITEESMKAAIESVEAGMAEWQIEAVARSKMAELGAEGTPYPPWVTSGPNTPLSLCRSTDRKVQKNELIQLTFGAQHMGYCGNMCRGLSIGTIPLGARKLMDAALEAMDYAFKAIRPGTQAQDVFSGYHELLSRYGYEEFTLYGPAHGTGSSEVEGLWLSRSADFVIQPGMLFNIDIWLSDGEHGIRYEDGILVNDKGIEQLTSYRREAISL